MLTDEQLKVLPDWIAPIAADLEWRCRHEQYAVGRDVSHEAQQLRIIVAYADALLELKWIDDFMRDSTSGKYTESVAQETSTHRRIQRYVFDLLDEMEAEDADDG